MRTTIDLPNSLMERAKRCSAERKSTFRALVISALEQALDVGLAPFKLRDASVGISSSGDEKSAPTVSNTEINKAIDTQRTPTFES